MPLNPNIILQAGKGVTPINRLDPMREALGIQQIQNNQRNALRQDRHDARLEKQDARADDEAKRQQRFRDLTSIVDERSYQAVRQKALGMDPSNAQIFPEAYDPAYVKQLVDHDAQGLGGAKAYLTRKSADARAKSTDDWRRFQAQERRDAQNRVKTPEQMAQARELKAAGAPRVSVANPAEEDAYDKYLVNKEYARVDEDAVNAENKLQSLRMMNSIDVSSGAAEPLKNWVSGLVEGLGGDPQTVGLESAANAQSFMAIAQKIVLDTMQAQKGPQTENDAKRIETTVSNLSNVPEAKDFITDAAIAVSSLKIEKRDFYQNWIEKKGSLRGASKKWTEHIAKRPLFVENPNTGRPVFFHQFQEENADKSYDELLERWRQVSGR